MSNENEKSESQRKIIDEDINRIDEALLSDDEEYVRKTHKTIDGKYQACIREWNKGMISFNLDYGFIYECLDMEDMKQNLEVMRPKLVAYKEGWNTKKSKADGDKSNINVVVNNNVDVRLNFEDARQTIEKMPGLSFADTELIKSKITELENILKEDTSKKSKWEKVKPIISFAIDKGADVAIVILSIIIQMNLGNK